LQWTDIEYIQSSTWYYDFDIDLVLASYSSPQIDTIIHAFKDLYRNGKIILSIFEPVNSEFFDQAYFNDLQGPEHLLRAFLESSSVRDVLSKLAIPFEIPYPLTPMPKYELYSYFELEGAITHLLYSGGAYTSHHYDEKVARNMSRDFVSALLPATNQKHHFIYRIYGAWTNWFDDVAWDTTFVICAPIDKRMMLFCMTDTD
jgi:hypothetical protein